MAEKRTAILNIFIYSHLKTKQNMKKTTVYRIAEMDSTGKFGFLPLNFEYHSNAILAAELMPEGVYKVEMLILISEDEIFFDDPEQENNMGEGLFKRPEGLHFQC